MEFSALLANESPQAAADALGELVDGEVYERSVTPVDDAILFLARQGRAKRAHMLGPGICSSDRACLGGEAAPVTVGGESLFLRTGALDHENACALRALLPWTAPTVLGTDASVGLGDRLGLATPGHVRAVRGTGIRPVFAQQSMREMHRTGRSPADVVDAATFGVLEGGYRDGYGADGDHLKTEEDIDACLAAGFTLFTVDPGAAVDHRAARLEGSVLVEAFASLPWAEAEASEAACRQAYAGKTFALEGGLKVEMTEAACLRAAVKYLPAVVHATRLYRHLASKAGDRAWEFELSVDETDAPTTPAEHTFIAAELQRLGVGPVSLAPRFSGRFEKGVDYIGEIAQFEKEFAVHAAIARTLGDYKLSLHSGSDKFSIYPIAARYARGRIHLKTAGTSWLEALDAVSRIDPDLFREVLALARARYPEDRASYHVSADPKQVLDPAALSDADLAGALEHFHTRQALHVTYGSVLGATDADGAAHLRDRLYETLETYEEAHYACLEMHLRRHVQPFA